MYGSLSTVDNVARFDWSHSYGKINFPKANYDPHGIFMYFENYNVEVRDRVKCITAAEGVPVSTQWQTQPYFYPTQIAQFGLSHYSKHLTEPEPRRKVITSTSTATTDWVTPENSSLTRSFDASIKSYVLHFATSSHMDSAIHLPLDHVLDLVLSIDLFMQPNASLIVTLQHRETKAYYYLNYIVADLLIAAQEENIYYGLGVSAAANRWKRVSRDLLVDLQKGQQLQQQQMSNAGGEKKRKLRRTEIRLTGIALHGHGAFGNVSLATSEHLAQFYDAAEWFVRHQDEKTGGWPNPVKRKLGSGFAELPSGWYSAMGQGHAISLLARAYAHSRGDERYLRAAIAGLRPFRVAAEDGGVVAMFMDKFAWYEEYPTQPASFILNGFIYSLLGLYDLNATTTGAVGGGFENDAGELLEQGLASLRRMLLLFDTGSGTSYDLRHLTLGIAPNLARWDYHVTHVNQLLLLATIDRDPLFAETAKRWQGYMVGKRAPHN